MKVELLVNLKLGNGKIIPAGTIYSDEKVPIPEYVMNRLKRRMARVVPTAPPPPSPSPKELLVAESTIEEPIEETAEAVEEIADAVEEIPKKKKIVKKKKSPKKKAVKETT